MAQAVARVTGYAGDDPQGPGRRRGRETMGTLAECLALDQHVDSRKAVRLLGWQPKHGGFADEVEECFEAWKAWSALDRRQGSGRAGQAPADDASRRGRRRSAARPRPSWA